MTIKIGHYEIDNLDKLGTIRVSNTLSSRSITLRPDESDVVKSFFLETFIDIHQMPLTAQKNEGTPKDVPYEPPSIEVAASYTGAYVAKLLHMADTSNAERALELLIQIQETLTGALKSVAELARAGASDDDIGE